MCRFRIEWVIPRIKNIIKRHTIKSSGNGKYYSVDILTADVEVKEIND